MRVIFAIIFLFAALIYVKADEKNDTTTYLLIGRVLDSTVEKKTYSEIVVRFEVTYKLTNVCEEAIILWDPAQSVTDSNDGGFHRFGRIVGKTFSTEADFAGSSILEESYGGPSNSYAKEWDILRERLDVARPPKELTITLLPNESLEFDSVVYLSAAENKGSNVIDIQALRHRKSIWLKTLHEVWSFNIEPRDPERATKLTFAGKVKRNWTSYGNLLVDDLISQPIRLDLSGAF